MQSPDFQQQYSQMMQSPDFQQKIAELMQSPDFQQQYSQMMQSPGFQQQQLNQNSGETYKTNTQAPNNSALSAPKQQNRIKQDGVNPSENIKFKLNKIKAPQNPISLLHLNNITIEKFCKNSLFIISILGNFYILNQIFSSGQAVLLRDQENQETRTYTLGRWISSIYCSWQLTPIMLNQLTRIISYENMLKIQAQFSSSKTYALAELYFNQGRLHEAASLYKQVLEADSHYCLAQLNVVLIEDIKNIYNFLKDKINMPKHHHDKYAEVLISRLERESLYGLAILFRNLAKKQTSQTIYDFSLKLFNAIKKSKNTQSLFDNTDQTFYKAQYNAGRCLYEIYRLSKDDHFLILKEAREKFLIASESKELNEKANHCIHIIDGATEDSTDTRAKAPYR